MIDDESLVKTRTNTCLSYTSAVPSYSVVMSSVQIKIVQLLTEQQVFTVLSCVKINQHGQNQIKVSNNFVMHKIHFYSVLHNRGFSKVVCIQIPTIA